ncbi:hypothetical protein J0667_16550 [Methylomonas sp. WH-1]|uniref:hypothetical protein n=1 Tax=unclassified Methylomonas TaxID=2608980 RepID=UPI00051BB841|nr:hypothetical protein [Methylomonas sp. LW13]
MIRKIIFYPILFLSTCATIDDSVYSPFYFGPDNISIGDARLKVRQFVRENPNNFSVSRMACDSLGIYAQNSKPINYPLSTCEKEAQEYYAEIRSEIKAKSYSANKDNLARQQERIDEEIRQIAAKKTAEEEDKKRKKDELKILLKTGKKQPESVEEASIFYDAKQGEALANSPKIKPDNQFYSMVGMINRMDGDNIFVAQLLTSRSYFKVRIPEKLKDEFEKTAKVNGWFGIVGKYTENSEVLLVLLQSVPVPIFDAVYFQSLN